MYLERRLSPPKGSFFLFGCRGTGKSTWVRKTYPDAIAISLLDEGLYQSFLADPSLFRQRLRALPRGSRVFVDEIQRLPQLLNEVHASIEEQGLRFILCGSSARKLKRAGVNLLGGRALERTLFPFLPQELGEDFRVDTALKLGLLPLIRASEEPEEQLEAYAKLYLKEEIQAEALVRNLPGFARFLPIAALAHGQTLNTTNIARDSGVARTTVEGYVQILEETLMAFRLPGFEGRLRVKERSTPKLFWMDPGIVRSVLAHGRIPTSELEGSLFEGLVATFLRAMSSYHQGLFDEITYWAPGEAHRTEVDFLLRQGNDYFAVECKTGRTPRSEWTRGLRAISDLKGLRWRVVVRPEGEALRTEEGIDILSFTAFVERIEAMVSAS